MNYRNYRNMRDAITTLVSKVPQVDAIIAVPRSGYIPACMLSAYRNLPIYTVNSFQKKSSLGGLRLPKDDKINSVLVIDDTAYTGTQISNVAKQLTDIEIYTAVVFTTEDAADKVDYYAEIVDSPRIFEWNFMHCDMTKNFVCDIDGVLCNDPTDEQNDDGENYINFILNAPPRYIPTYPIGTLISCRLEKYRDITIEWLNKYKIQYNELIMMPLKTKEERIASNFYAEFKAEYYKSKGDLFIESSIQQANKIFKLTNKPVLCIETHELISGESL